MASEILKARTQRGLPPNLFFYRDRKGAEMDAIVELARELLAVEAKSGQTVAGDSFTGLHAFSSAIEESRARRKVLRFVVYGGAESQRRSAGTVVPWSRLGRCQWWDRNE